MKQNCLIKIVKELISLPNEEEWFEFKENWYEPAGIGEYISSLSNTAAMLGKDQAYLIWGITNDNKDKEEMNVSAIVGLCPFLSKKTVEKVAAEIIKRGGIGALTPIAPFL
ncbi:MAG: ATP-binding protein [Lachnospiraceae bacterium]|nr:ATP-binding protein [Lachnospiraceae bacterium]